MSILLAGRYRLGPKVGEGGMAVVYRAEDMVLGRTVAVKVLREQYAADAGFRERFQQEARTAAGLSHPHIVSLFDVGDSDGRPFIVMELVEGPTLKQVLADGPLPINQVVELGEQICEAMAAAHARGIIHRDIKPQNVLLQSADPGALPFAKIADFGIARAQGAASTSETGQVLGSVHYISPEQARGRPATAASDVYSGGVVLYEMLTGRPPFTGETVVGVAMQHVQDEPLPPRKLNPRTPVALERIVLKAMAKDPAQRFASASEMARALAEFRALGEGATMAVSPLPAVAARRPAPLPTAPPRTEGGDWLFTLLAVLTAVFVLGLAGLGVVVYQNYIQAPAIAATSPEPSASPASTAPAASPSATRPAATPTLTAVPRVEVPPVLGLPALQARGMLEALGLRYREARQEFSDRIAAGSVISQSVAASQPITPGATIAVILSKGPPPTPTPAGQEVPYLVDLSYEDAADRVRARGLKITRREESIPGRPGLVLRQDPSGGERVPAGSTVTVWVGRAQQMVEVPDLIGEPEKKALKALEKAELKLWPYGVNYQGHADLPDDVLRRVEVGSVLSTTPPPGTSVPLGTEVQVAVRKD